MATLNDIFDLVKTLSENDREKLKDMISSTITKQNILINYVTEKRFASGAFCPHCKSNHIKRNGHKNNVQRYLCLDCKKTFNITTNTIVSSTKKDLLVWNQYIDCMMEGYSIRKAAEKCGINKSTAFEWRHKILDALQNMAESVKLDGIIEGDETFFFHFVQGKSQK